MDKKFSSIGNVRMPAILVPAFNALMKTPEGSAAMKRIKVGCGICKSTKYYGITRGVTRVASVVACENCRHFYQKIRRDPVSLSCIAEDKASCYRNETFLETKCKACWAMQLLDGCPHDDSVYDSISKLLSDDCKKVIRGFPMLPEDLPDDSLGSLALEVLKDDLWIPAPSGEEGDLVKSVDEFSSHGDSNSGDIFDRSDEFPIDESLNNFSNKVSDVESSEILNKNILIESVSDQSIKDDSEKGLSKESSKNSSKTFTKEIPSHSHNSEIADIDEDEIMVKSPKEIDAKDEDSDNLSENPRITQTEADRTKMTFKLATITSQDFDDAEMDEDELTVDDPAPVNVGIVTRRKKESNEEDNLTLKKSERIKRKRKKVEYFNKPVEQKTGRRMKGLVHGPNGALLKNGKDLCDCLQEDCPGCHFPCPKCRSPKCGNECRVNRRWYYEKVEVEGTKISFVNKFAPKM